MVVCRCIALVAKLFKEIGMSLTETHDATAHDTTTPRVLLRDEIYEHFKEENWWAKNPQAWKIPLTLYFLALIPLVLMRAITPEIVLLAAFGVLPLLLLLVLAKIFLHDRPWKKYKRDWIIEDRIPSSDIGGVLKIYD